MKYRIVVFNLDGKFLKLDKKNQMEGERE